MTPRSIIILLTVAIVVTFAVPVALGAPTHMVLLALGGVWFIGVTILCIIVGRDARRWKRKAKE